MLFLYEWEELQDIFLHHTSTAAARMRAHDADRTQAIVEVIDDPADEMKWVGREEVTEIPEDWVVFPDPGHADS